MNGVIMNDLETKFAIVLTIILCLGISALITFWSRLLFETVMKKNIVKFKSKIDEYNGYFSIMFLLMYIPGFNVIFVISMLCLIEIDNLKQFRKNYYK